MSAAVPQVSAHRATVQRVVVLAGQDPDAADLRRLRALDRRLGPARRRGGLRLVVVAGTALDLPGAELIVGRPVRVDPADRLVTVSGAAGARHLTYDQLVVLGPGAQTPGPAATERRRAGRPDPARVRARLAAWLRGLDPGAGPAIHHIVVLGGAAGSELAASLAELLRAAARRPAWQGQYLCLHLCAAPDLAPRQRARLEALGVQVRPDDLAADPLRHLRPALVFSPARPGPALPGTAAWPRDPHGRLRTGADGRLAGQPNVWAFGGGATGAGPRLEPLLRFLLAARGDRGPWRWPWSPRASGGARSLRMG